MKQSRRTFLQNTSKIAATSALVAGFPHILSSRSPNETLNFGLIGCRGRGFRVLEQHLDIGGVVCTALCDIDENVLNEKSKVLDEKYQQKPKIYRDFRKLLEDKDIDAVIIGTPDHWHCLQMIYACEAGKDVYVEKPMANSIEECNLMVKAAKRYNRIVQVGQQQRSGMVWADVMDYIHAGRIGKIRKTNIWANFNYGLGPQKQADAAVPHGVDYDMYLGPAQKRPFNPARFHGGWRMFWDYGGGLMTDFGVHLIDMALWARNITTEPETVLAFGNQLDRPDLSRETFDTMSVVYTIGDYVIQWESNAGIQKGPYDKNYGLAFIGEKGTVVANRGEWQVIPEWDGEKKAFKVDEYTSRKYEQGHDDHMQNFIYCIKNRKTPACPPEMGRNVALYAHMGNMAVRSGEYKLEWDNEKGKFKEGKGANQLIKPEYHNGWGLPKV